MLWRIYTYPWMSHELSTDSVNKSIRLSDSKSVITISLLKAYGYKMDSIHEGKATNMLWRVELNCAIKPRHVIIKLHVVGSLFRTGQFAIYQHHLPLDELAILCTNYIVGTGTILPLARESGGTRIPRI